MNPKKIITNTRPSELAKARGKLQAHSTRDFPKFITQLEHIMEAFKNLGYTLEAKKSTSKDR